MSQIIMVHLQKTIWLLCWKIKSIIILPAKITCHPRRQNTMIIIKRGQLMRSLIIMVHQQKIICHQWKRIKNTTILPTKSICHHLTTMRVMEVRHMPSQITMGLQQKIICIQ